MEKIKSAVIGAGQYGTAVIAQQFFACGMEARLIADIDVQKARTAYLLAGIDEAQITYAATERDVLRALNDGKYIYTDHTELIFGVKEIRVVCDCTGNPEAGARIALQACESGNNLVCVGKEADSAVGPILKRKFAERGLIYSAAEGDQPALIVQTVKWARALGLTVIAAGKYRDGELLCSEDLSEVRLWDFTTNVAADKRALLKNFQGNISENLAARKRILSALPSAGGYDFCELCIVANYTGLKPVSPDLIQAPLHVSEVASVYCERNYGGILDGAGYIDMVQPLRFESEASAGGGVFAVVRAENAYAQSVLVDKTGGANADGSACLLSRPFHLCGVETVGTLLRAARNIDGTNGMTLGLDDGETDYRQRYDIVRIAKRTIAAGEKFGDDHSGQFDTQIFPASVRNSNAPVPAHLLTGNIAATDIPAGSIIKYSHVVPPRDSLLWTLREEQEKAAFSEK